METVDQDTYENIEKIRGIIAAYYDLPNGYKIENPDELLALFAINNHLHPHNGLIVYISRRSLKHFVERRKEELLKNNNRDRSLAFMCFIVENIQATILEFDSCTKEITGKCFYKKRYPISSKRQRSIRIVLEIKESRLEIISIHLRKN